MFQSKDWGLGLGKGGRGKGKREEPSPYPLTLRVRQLPAEGNPPAALVSPFSPLKSPQSSIPIAPYPQRGPRVPQSPIPNLDKLRDFEPVYC